MTRCIAAGAHAQPLVAHDIVLARSAVAATASAVRGSTCKHCGRGMGTQAGHSGRGRQAHVHQILFQLTFRVLLPIECCFKCRIWGNAEVPPSPGSNLKCCGSGAITTLLGRRRWRRGQPAPAQHHTLTARLLWGECAQECCSSNKNDGLHHSISCIAPSGGAVMKAARRADSRCSQPAGSQP